MPRETPFQRQPLYRLAYLLLMAVGYEKVLKVGAYDVTLEDGAICLDIYISNVPKKEDPNTNSSVSPKWQEFHMGLIKKFIGEHKLVFTESPILKNPKPESSFIDSNFYGMRFLWKDVQNNESVLATVEKLNADPNAAAFCQGWAELGEEWDYVDYIQATLENFSLGIVGMDLSEAFIDIIFADSQFAPRKMIRTRPWDDIDDCKEYTYTHIEIDSYSKITFVLKNRSSEKELLISVNWQDIPWNIFTGNDPCPQAWQDNFSALQKKQTFVNPADYEKILDAISGTIEYKKGIGLQLLTKDRSLVDKLSLLGIKSLTSTAPRESIMYGIGMQSYYYARNDITNILSVSEVILKKERATREIQVHSPSSFFNANRQRNVPDSYKVCEKGMSSLKP